MKVAQIQIGWLVLIASCAVAQNAARTLHGIKVERAANEVHIEFGLSAPVQPSVLLTRDPTRIVLDFPNTTAKPGQQRIAVNFNGIKAVRFGLYKANPPVARVVVDLDRMHSYQLHGESPHILLTVGPAVGSPVESNSTQRHAPSAGASVGLFEVFRHRPPAPPEVRSPQAPSAVSSAKQPEASTVLSSVTNGARSDSVSSQPGTVFPNLSSTTDIRKTSATETVPPSTTPQSNRSAATAASTPKPGISSEAPTPRALAKTPTPAAGETVATISATKPDTTEQSVQAAALDPNLKTVFKVKYVAEGAAYLDGGRSSGLTEGMKLEVRETDLPVQQGSTGDASDPRVMAELEVIAVAETSAVTDIHSSKRAVKQGDLAYLSSGDAQALVQQQSLSATRKYPVVVTFTGDDPQDEEVRAEVPRPPPPSVNRARGWIGIDHMGTISHGDSGTTSSDLGLVVRADITRLNGTYWNVTGYWRGRLSSQSSSSQPTLQDLINRTYHLGMTYENPNSRWVAGFGRLYLPWAPSLNTIDGGYFGARVGKSTTAGIFAGSTPDPTSWNYNPDQRIGGAFVNFQGGSYDDFYYTSTSGVGISTVKWTADRPFVFFENSISYKRYVSIYDSLQADSPRGNAAVAAPGPGLSRNFLTVRLQVHPRLELDLNHNYFRDIPTFDTALIGTGLLDKYLFQGFSVGARAEVARQIFVYTDVGRSNRTGDATNSWNEMFGVTFGRLPWLGLRADAHYSRFNSPFGDGSYKSFSLSRDFSESLRLGVLAGTQDYVSTLATNNRSRFLNGNAEWSFGAHYFMQGGLTVNHGGALSYDQWMFTLGWRFDSKEKHQ